MNFSLYKNWDNREVDDWLRKSKNSKKNYVLLHGVAMWGGWCFCCVTLAMLFANDIFDLSFGDVIFNLFIFGLLGALYGHLCWEGTNASYKRRFSDKETSDL